MATVPHSCAPASGETVRAFRTLAGPFRFRVLRDVEGFPVIPGRLGQIEYHDGRFMAVYTDRPRLFTRLWALAGIQRWQVGDQEARGLFPPSLLPQVAGLIRARRCRSGPRLTSEQALRLRAGARLSAASAA